MSLLRPHLRMPMKMKKRKNPLCSFSINFMKSCLSPFSFMLISNVSPNLVLREEMPYRTNESGKIRVVPTQLKSACIQMESTLSGTPF